MSAWYTSQTALLDQLRRDLASAYPNLHIYIEVERVFVRGSFPIEHDGKILDRYSIQIELLDGFPDVMPVVREIGGRIARTVDDHVLNTEGDSCLFLREEEWKHYPKGIAFIDFLNGPVRNYFLGHSLVALGRPWPFGERPHGAAGVLEYYQEEFDVSDLEAIIRLVRCIASKSPSGHRPCPCGSGLKIRRCHQLKLRELQEKIPAATALHSLAFLKLLRR